LASPQEFHWDSRIFFEFFRVWDGGLVFYGSAVGGAIGYFFAHRFVLRKHGISPWKMVDIIAPCVALGLCLGRIRCLLNGCCSGTGAACAGCPAGHFPLSSPPRFDMVRRGYQTAAGFLVDDSDPRRPPTVTVVEPDSAAAAAGLREGDEILEVNGHTVNERV